MQSYGFDISHMSVQCMCNRVILATLQLEEVLDIDLFYSVYHVVIHEI